MKGLILVFQFFTRIPININIDFNEKNVRYAFYFFPLLGGLIGFAVMLPVYLLHGKFDNLGSFFSLLLYIILTGGIHLDGLADTFDGFCSSRSKEKILDIMKDPHSGTFAVLALISSCLLRFICYGSLMPYIGIFIFAGIISRFSGLTVVIFSVPAKDSGLGAMFHKSVSKTSFFLWLFVICVLCIFYPEISEFSFIPNFLSFNFIKRLKFLSFPLAAFLLTCIIIQISYKKIEGTTGDVNGCIVELTELAIFLLALIMH